MARAAIPDSGRRACQPWRVDGFPRRSAAKLLQSVSGAADLRSQLNVRLANVVVQRFVKERAGIV